MMRACVCVSSRGREVERERGGQGGVLVGLVSHQDFVGHLLNLLGFGLYVVLKLVLPSFHHLQSLHLVLQGLPALLSTHTHAHV